MEELPLGYRFYPTEQELISFYLHNKLEGRRPELQRVIPDISIYDIEPWDLPRNFSAFDRRPLEALTRETLLLGDTATTSAQCPTIVEMTSSPETSSSGGDHVNHPETATSTNWGMVDGLQPPAWEWAELDWP